MLIFKISTAFEKLQRREIDSWLQTIEWIEIFTGIKWSVEATLNSALSKHVNMLGAFIVFYKKVIL